MGKDARTDLLGMETAVHSIIPIAPWRSFDIANPTLGWIDVGEKAHKAIVPQTDWSSVMLWHVRAISRSLRRFWWDYKLHSFTAANRIV